MEPTLPYTSDVVEILPTREHIRRRPHLYVGPLPNPAILNRLVEESLCLSVDEAASGNCTEISVEVHPSGDVRIRDNGLGLPLEPGPDGRVLAEVLLTTLGACRASKRNESAKEACCHVGLVVVNSLTEWLRVRLFRDGGCWLQEYCVGLAQGSFRREADTRETGLELTFRPEFGILGPWKFDGLALAGWLARAGVQFQLLDYHPRAGDEPTMLRFRDIRPHNVRL